MKSWFVIILVLVSACARPDHKLSAGPEFLEYVQRFESEFGMSAAGIGIRFDSNLSTQISGLCTRFDRPQDGPSEITINPQHWDLYSDLSKEQLIYHELGHCAMHLGHIDSRIQITGSGEIPSSIMNPYMLSVWYYHKFRPQYVKALPLNRGFLVSDLN